MRAYGVVHSIMMATNVSPCMIYIIKSNNQSNSFRLKHQDMMFEILMSGLILTY